MKKITRIGASQNVPFRPLNFNLRITNFRDIPEGVTEEIYVDWGDGNRNTYHVTKRTGARPFSHSYRVNTTGMMNPAAFSIKNFNITVEHPSYLNIIR